MSARVPPAPRASGRPSVPVVDHVTDVVAAVLLLASLALPWDLGHQAAERVDVVLVTLLSVASLALPHLARAGVFPLGWTVLSTRRARLLANIPYAVMVLVYLVLDATGGLGTGEGAGTVVRGVGYAVALGLAGAVLAAQPRRSELGPPDQDAEVGPLWFTVAAVLAGACGLLLVVGTVVGLVGAARPQPGGGGAALAVASILVAAAQTAVLALPLLAVVRRDAAWRPVVAAVGAAVTLGLLCSALASGYGVSTVQSAGSALLLVPASAAAAAAPATLRVLHRSGATTAGTVGDAAEAPARGWFRAAERLWLVLASAALLQVVTTVLQMVAYEPLRGSAAVVVVVMLLVTAGTSLAGRARLADDPSTAAPAALLLAGAGLVAGIIALAVVGAAVDLAADAALVTTALWVPVALVALLTLPPSVRALSLAARSRPPGAPAGPSSAPDWHLPPSARRDDAVPGVPAPGTSGPAAPRPEPAAAGREAAEEAAAPPEHVHPFTPQQAADPTTDLAVLATICADAPELRPYVAANPSAYRELLQWLGTLGDERVDRALSSRPLR